MRRIVPVVLAVVIVACDPTGNGLPVIDSADLRFANFVTDAGGMSLGTLGGNVANGITFGTTSLSSALPVGETIFTGPAGSPWCSPISPPRPRRSPPPGTGR